MQQEATRKPRDWFSICSWIALILIFAALVLFMTAHSEDLLDADMSSELVLAKQLATGGGILSDNWYYSTELRVLNTQLVYSAFFHVTSDWRTVRVLSSVTLYLVLLASYYFFCRRQGIGRYFPLSAAILLLPLSAPYFYILLYGAYYIPRVSIMFVILGILLPMNAPKRKASTIVLTTIACLLSFALGLEGARMLLVLFLPLAIVAGAELFKRLLVPKPDRLLRLKQDGFIRYLLQAFLVCCAALVGFVLNQKVLIDRYPFEQLGALSPKLTLNGIYGTLYNQIHVLGSSPAGTAISVVLWLAIGALLVWYVFHKGEKRVFARRYVWLTLAAWACYTAFCCLIQFGQVAWHLVPVVVLFLPAAVIALREIKMRLALRRLVCLAIGLCFLLLGLQGYAEFENWTLRQEIRTSASYRKISDTLEEAGYRNGYATFWNANILTELSDGDIDVWCVESFDATTPQHPAIYHWLQAKTHDIDRPSGKTFAMWSAEEYETYGKQAFPYLGEILYQDSAFVVFDVTK